METKTVLETFLGPQRQPSTYTVKETEHWLVEVVEMIYNFRIVLTEKAGNTDTWEYGWCFRGKDIGDLLTVASAAREFDPETQTEPEGYFKAVGGKRTTTGAS
jgi:hypothetical protein